MWTYLIIGLANELDIFKGWIATVSKAAETTSKRFGRAYPRHE